MSALDHVFVVLFAVVYPAAGFIGFRRLLRKMKAGVPVDRKHLYVSTICWQWILFVLLLLVWADAGRSWRALGFGPDLNGRLVAAVAVGIAGVTMLIAQLRRVASATQHDLEALRSGLGNLSFLVPHERGELLRFNALSITAGVVEETLWRGFLIWYLGQYLPLWAAATISAVGFGLAHGYQGLRNVPRIVLVGAVLAGVFVLTGSLWLPIVLHAAVDLLQGRLAYEVLRRSDRSS